jgi:quercetin dioxygenase-like cupin family protein
VAPNGTVVEVLPAAPEPVVPPAAPRFELTRAGPGGGDPGRAGMRYRDLLPQRQGGRFVASHNEIPEGGPVPDYVHYHRIRFQMIYCHRGWVRVVYEGQGPPFVMRPGDCVLQPPEIRHRVLESSPGLEVIEVGCPALHDTLTDPATPLPTGRHQPDRLFGGQRFVRHVAAGAPWEPIDGQLERRDTGIGDATGGLAGVGVLRPGSPAARLDPTPGFELELLVVVSGTVELERPGAPVERLAEGDALAMPPEPGHVLAAWSADAEVLEVRLPAFGSTPGG